jgi:RsiW-degrading membrane proteinase PrsW (M82 family)
MEIVLSFIAVIIFIYIYIQDVRAYRRKGGQLKNAPYFQFTISTTLIVLMSIGLVNGFLMDPISTSGTTLFISSVILSLLVARVWLLYVKWIDVYEPERNIHLAITFFLSCLTLILVFPLTQLINSAGFVLNGDPVNDFLYSFIAIGMVEEFVKFIPLLVMIKLTKHVNEPIDYIVYASVSALGFAFIENILYIQSTNLASLSARLLYSSVAHMFFSSIIGYALAINAIQNKKNFTGHLIVGFLLASLAHGFYDFWLINDEFYLPWVTTVFYIGSLHIWVTLKNNLINNTNFYRPDISLDRNNIKYKLLSHLVFTIYMGYIAYAVLNGAEEANYFLAYSVMSFLFLVVYLSFSFSSFNIIRGYIAPISFPVKFFLPKVDAYPNYSGINIQLKILVRKGITETYNGVLRKRLVLKKDYNWYLFEDEEHNQFVVKPYEYTHPFEESSMKRLTVCSYSRKLHTSNLHLDSKFLSKPLKGVGRLLANHK